MIGSKCRRSLQTLQKRGLSARREILHERGQPHHRRCKRCHRATEQEIPCVERGLMINSLSAEAGLLVLHKMWRGILCTPCSLSRSFIPPQINVRCPPKPGSSSRPRSSVCKTTHTPDISLPSPLQCLPITSSQKLQSFLPPA